MDAPWALGMERQALGAAGEVWQIGVTLCGGGGSTKRTSMHLDINS